MWDQTCSKYMYPYIQLDESPKIAVTNKNDTGLKNDKKYSMKKEQIKDSTPKLPPKPQGHQNLNYKLPPKKPTVGYEASSKQEVKP